MSLVVHIATKFHFLARQAHGRTPRHAPKMTKGGSRGRFHIATNEETGKELKTSVERKGSRYRPRPPSAPTPPLKEDISAARGDERRTVSKPGPQNPTGNEDKRKRTLGDHSQKGNVLTLPDTLPGPSIKETSEMGSGYRPSPLQRLGGKGSMEQRSQRKSGSDSPRGSMVWRGSSMRGGAASGTFNPALLRLMSEQKSSDSDCFFDDRVVRKRRSSKSEKAKETLMEAKLASEDRWREKIERTSEDGRSESIDEGSSSVKSSRMRAHGNRSFDRLSSRVGDGSRDE